MPTLHLTLPQHSYDILVEPGALARLGEIVQSVAPADRTLIAADEAIAETFGRNAAATLKSHGLAVASVALVADEARKSLDTVRELYRAMLEARLERGSPVIAVGGGIVGDVAGFAAATFQRGVPLIHVPTTLLAMVDAAIGGKTGVNIELPVADDGEVPLGKNMVGAFWQPRAVIADPETLRSLPARELRCGLAECVKHAMIADPGLLGLIERDAERLVGVDLDALTELIVRSAAVKIAMVAEDEREAGRRMLLNLGHTFGHAMESVRELGLKHGEAVAIGLVAAARCAVTTGRMSEPDAARVSHVLQRIRLPVRLPHQVAIDRLLRAMRYDKKIAAGELRLVLPRGIGEAEVCERVAVDAIRAAWQAVGAVM